MLVICMYCLHTAVGLVQEAESHPVRFSRREAEALPAHLSADTLHIKKQARRFLKPCSGPLRWERSFGFLEEKKGKKRERREDGDSGEEEGKPEMRKGCSERRGEKEAKIQRKVVSGQVGGGANMLQPKGRDLQGQALWFHHLLPVGPWTIWGLP